MTWTRLDSAFELQERHRITVADRDPATSKPTATVVAARYVGAVIVLIGIDSILIML